MQAAYDGTDRIYDGKKFGNATGQIQGEYLRRRGFIGSSGFKCGTTGNGFIDALYAYYFPGK